MINESMKNICECTKLVSLNVWLGETLLSFLKTTMSVLNMDKLLMLLKFQMVMKQ